MKWLLARPKRMFWILFAFLMTPGVWRMRPPWRTDGWSLTELVAVTILFLVLNAVVSAALAGLMTMMARGAATWPEQGSAPRH